MVADGNRHAYVSAKELFCLFSILIVGMQLCGCARYTPKPLNPQDAFDETQRVSLNDFFAEHGKADQGTNAKIDLTDGLDADEVAYAAIFLNPGLKTKRAEKGIAAGQLIAAGLWPNPELSSNFRWEKAGPGRSFEPELSFEILRWNERKGKRQAAQANVEAVHFETLADEWKVVSDARAAYWDVVALQEKLRLSKEAVDVADKLAKSVRARVTRGVATSMDQSLADLDRSRIELESKRAEGELVSAERNLKLGIGLPPNAEIKLHVSEKAIARFPRTWTYDETVLFLTDTPAMKAAEWRYRVSEGELRAAIARQYPGLKIGPSNSVEFDGQWTSFIGFLISIDLPILNQNGGEIREKASAREKAHAEYLARLHELKGALAEAFGQVETTETLLDFQEKLILPKVQETLRLTERALEAGELGAFELFKAQSSIIESKQEYLKALVAYRTALQSVERTMGRPLSDIPSHHENQAPAVKPAQGE